MKLERIFPVTVLYLLACASRAQLQPTIQDNWWVTDGDVNAIVTDAPNNRVFIGGQFNVVGPNAPYGAKLSYPGISPDLSYHKPNGRVRAVVSDGSGGWFIGGDFTEVNGTASLKLAKLGTDGHLDQTWIANVTGAGAVVNALAYDPFTASLYVGGDFNTIGSQSRSDLAKVSGTGTGAVDVAFQANTTAGAVNSLALDGGTLYVGGDFTDIGGTTLDRLVKVNTTTGAVDNAWAPQPDAIVRTMMLSNGQLYVGGDFTNIGGAPRNRLARIDGSGNADGWDPSVSGPAYALAAFGASIIAGGSFTQANTSGTAATRLNIAAFDALSGTVQPWYPTGGASHKVTALFTMGGDLLVAGDFNTIGAVSRWRMAALTGAAVPTAWSPAPGGAIDAIATDGLGNLYVAGGLKCIGGSPANNLAAIDPATGMQLPWPVFVNGQVSSLLLDGSTLYAGGFFTTANGQTRQRAAAFDATGVLLPWDPMVSGTGLPAVRALCKLGPSIYLGGQFTGVGGQPRINGAAVDATTGSPLAWDPNAGASTHAIISLATDGSSIYAGGNFPSIGGAGPPNFAKLDAATGAALAWGAGANGVVSAIHMNAGFVYVGGAFSAVHGASRDNLARINAGDGVVDPAWAPVVNNTVLAITSHGEAILLGGTFTTVEGQNYPKIDALSRTTGAPLYWPQGISTVPTDRVNAIGFLGNTVVAGGQFATAGGAMRHALAGYAYCTPADYWGDGDNDGYGDPATFIFSCTQLPFWLTNHDDCDDHSDEKYPGAPCDDGDPATINDVFDADCVCEGSILCDHDLELVITLDNFGSQISWIILNSSFLYSAGGGPYADGQAGTVITEELCLEDDCYYLYFYDDFGDGMCCTNGNGGYLLRTLDGRAIIGNTADGSFTYQSSISHSDDVTNTGPLDWCLPLGSGELSATYCGRADLIYRSTIMAEEDPAVSAQYGIGDQSDDGYGFWIFNPDGGYSQSITRTHAQPGNAGPNGPTKCAYLKLNYTTASLAAAGQLSKWLNVRVRTKVNGLWSEYGPACAFKITTDPCTQLVDEPGNTQHSCGVTRTFGGSDKVWCYVVAGASEYQFKFQAPGYSRNIASANAARLLNWATQPLVNGVTYSVTVQAKVDGVYQGFCGAACDVTIANPPSVPLRDQEFPPHPDDLLVFPNPNDGSRLHIELLGSGSDQVEMELYDATGRVVLIRSLRAEAGHVNTVVDLGDALRPGPYTLRLNEANSRWSERIMVVR